MVDLQLYGSCQAFNCTSYAQGGSSALREEEEEEDGVDEVDSHAKGFRPKLTLNVSQRHPIGGGGGGDRRLDDDDHEEDKMPSIPEGEFRVYQKVRVGGV